ncbi:hypothetical protein [Varunaivibrio sulfuroxidans]|uniref:hypothetical protein n=1 Tax=Varunaivibrio sulfuroxidans TaxID=1773489 RepID=UPI00104B2C9B|nr:hypothetical protein [Varunaivibrio sulfuroxidans]WES29912.1 hypothetical protein P3M64_09700 [Varunaivibrio sulfuroxidans]
MNIKKARVATRRWLLETKLGRLILLFIAPLVLLPDDLKGNGLYSRFGGALNIAGPASAFFGYAIAKFLGVLIMLVPYPTMLSLSSAYRVFNKAEWELRVAGIVIAFVCIFLYAGFSWFFEKGFGAVSRKLVGSSNPPGFNYFVLMGASGFCWAGSMLFFVSLLAPVVQDRGIAGLSARVSAHPWWGLTATIVMILLWERKNYMKSQAARQIYANGWIAFGRNIIFFLLLVGMILLVLVGMILGLTYPR